jgi:RHS repeat-associated protein
MHSVSLKFLVGILSFSDYYPFGMQMVGRNDPGDGYRYGFNGMERDDEVKGSGNSYDFGARMYDARLGRWLSLDPLESRYKSLTPYNYVANSPLQFVDPNGEEIVLFFKTPAAKTAYESVLNSSLEGGYTIKLHKLENGHHRVEFVSKGEASISEMSQRATKVYEYLNPIATDPNVKVEMLVVAEGFERILAAVGNYEDAILDMSDVMQFNETGKKTKTYGQTQVGAIVHETLEQYEKTKAGIPRGSKKDFSTHHRTALAAENDVNGIVRKQQTGYDETDGTKGNFWRKYEITHTDGTVTQSTMTFAEGTAKLPTIRVSQPGTVTKVGLDIAAIAAAGKAHLGIESAAKE